MHFARFWAKGEHEGFACWRWSDIGHADALALAQQAARRIAERILAGETPRHGYGYADRPLREPVLREIRAPDGTQVAVITRNSYGCVVLNTNRIMFVDVDLPEPATPSAGWLSRLFGKPERADDGPSEAEVLARATAWQDTHPGWGWRVYRTKAGLRLLATHALFDPGAATTLESFQALGADPLYRTLCGVQKCFRARLTPKPWRCGVELPPGRWPWPDAKAESRFKAWDARYLNASRNYATCSLIAATGSRKLDPSVELILNVHDQSTQSQSKLELA